MKTPRSLLALGIALACSAPAAAAPGGESARAPAAMGAVSTQRITPPPAVGRGWAADFPEMRAEVAEGAPFVVAVVVPLCDNAQIHCGSVAAGAPGRLDTNLYWGAVFGARRFFERKASAWARVERGPGAHPTLERAVYRRMAPGAAWGAAREVEQIVVIEAVHGGSIDEAVRRFWARATGGGRVAFQDGGRRREARVHVAGYAGHNRLMDGLALPAAPEARAGIPSFVLACHSERYFAGALDAAGSRLLFSTRALMAPEGYLLDALVRGLGDNAPATEVRRRAVAAYAEWQRLSPGVASGMFTPAK